MKNPGRRILRDISLFPGIQGDVSHIRPFQSLVTQGLDVVLDIDLHLAVQNSIFVVDFAATFDRREHIM